MALTESGNNGFSLADAMAMTNGANSGFGGGAGGTWIWVFFLFFLLAWGGNGMFGGSNAANQGALTRAELQQGLGQQDVFRNQDMIATELNAFERDAANNWGSIKYDNLKNVSDLQSGMENEFHSLNTTLLNGFNNVNSGLSENRFTTQQGFCETNRNIDAVRYENSKNTCEIINAQNNNTQKILDAITQTQIQTLRDELSNARAALSNTLQTQNLLSALQPVPRPSYLTTSPYTSTSNYCGCGV